MDTLQIAIRNAQSTLSRLDAEEASLRQKLQENRAEYLATGNFLKLAAVFGGVESLAPERTVEIAEVQSEIGAVNESDSTDARQAVAGEPIIERADPSSPMELLQARQPYGIWPRAVNACVDMLKAAGKPMKTKTLLEGLVEQGFHFTVGDPYGSLSGKLGRSLKVRSHPKLGWHLAEWPIMPAKLTDDERRKILDAIQAHVEEQPIPTPPSEAATDPFFGKTAPKVAMEVLRRNGAPMKTAEVTLAMEQGGYPFTQEDHADAVDHALKRRVRLKGDVRRVAPGTWGLTEWYSADELAELDVKLGVVNGIRGSSKALKQSLQKLKDRGIKLGTPSRYTDQEMMAACRLIQLGGQDPKAVADTLGVKVVTVNRWLQKSLNQNSP